MTDSELLRTFGENLRAYREGRGLSQTAFAEQLGVDRNYLGGIERGERNPTLKSVERLCERIGKEPLELLRGKVRT